MIFHIGDFMMKNKKIGENEENIRTKEVKIMMCMKCSTDVNECEHCGVAFEDGDEIFCLDNGGHLCSEDCLLNYYNDNYEGFEQSESESEVEKKYE
jgi:predicted N-acyltransferase